MVRIPYIEIPSVRVGSIVPTSNIGTGGATPVPPRTFTYLTQWKIVGNSELHDNEIWSCGEYNAIDGKYHILIQPQGGSIADIALDAPLRKVNDVADTIEFPSDTEGNALVTRNLKSVIIGNITPIISATSIHDKYRFTIVNDSKPLPNYSTKGNILCAKYPTITGYNVFTCHTGIGGYSNNFLQVYDDNHNFTVEDFVAANVDTEVIYEPATPTTELVDAPQIQEAESYTCVISQGGKAVEWSSFETDSE